MLRHNYISSRLDREKKALQAKLSQQQHENEMEEWRDSIMTSREFVSNYIIVGLFVINISNSSITLLFFNREIVKTLDMELISWADPEGGDRGPRPP